MLEFPPNILQSAKHPFSPPDVAADLFRKIFGSKSIDIEDTPKYYIEIKGVGDKFQYCTDDVKLFNKVKQAVIKTIQEHNGK